MSVNNEEKLTAFQSLIRDFIVAMMPVPGTKESKVAAAKYFARQILDSESILPGEKVAGERRVFKNECR